MTKIDASVLFFLEGENVPASRFRVQQYEKVLKNAGVRYKFLYTWPDKYLNSCFTERCPFFLRLFVLAISLFFVVFQRLFQILLFSRSYDVIVLQRDLLYRVHYPFLELFLFRFAGSRARIVFDVDDAIFLDKKGEYSPGLHKKLSRIISKAHLVIAGNKYLEGYFRQFAPTVIIPTVLDMSRYENKRAISDTPIIGWTGTRANLKYVRALEQTLQELAQSHTFRLVLVCEGGTKSPFLSDLHKIEMREWSAEKEVDLISDFSIGIMPLPDDEWSRGKCGLKLLQYMALGIPSVASEVGVNSEIVIHGESGFLVKDSQGFKERIARLLTDPGLRRNVGDKGRQEVLNKYSLESVAELWLRSILGEKNQGNYSAQSK